MNFSCNFLNCLKSSYLLLFNFMFTVQRRKMSRALVILAAIVGLGSIVLWSKRGPNLLEVHHDDNIRITKYGELFVSWEGRESVRGQMAVGVANYPAECKESSLCLEWSNYAQLKIEREEVRGEIMCHHFHWEAAPRISALEDCFVMSPAHWYGAGEVVHQHWPLEEWDMPMTPFLSGDMLSSYPKNTNVYGSVIEPYWLSSRGVGIRVEPSTPLHVKIADQRLCLRSTYRDSKYQRIHDTLKMDYTLCTGRNVREVHDYMRTRYFSVPQGFPDELMFISPIWSTWASYKVFINESSVMEFARNIQKHKFKSSQLELDDGYQVAHGDFTFDPQKFPNPEKTISALHKLGFRVTVWVHPFVNPDAKAFADGASLEYFVKDEHGGPGIVQWWNGRGALVDFTNPDAAKWYTDRLGEFKENTGVDSFKFDAGETGYLVDNFKTHAKLVNPGEFTTHYVKVVSTFGPMIEVRAAYQNQDQAVFVRMMDKQSSWGWDDGLKTVLTTAITFSILGYPYILPDMIGGNSYTEDDFHGTQMPSRELFIRWVELSAFLPSMQYSVQPWHYDEEVTRIAHRWTSFHEEFISPKVLKIIKEETVVDGSPIIRPLWWIAPEDPFATRIDCEFLVGNDILVAPVVDRGIRARDVYLPAGEWMSPSGSILAGGRWYGQMSAPLDEILYFIKQ